MEELLDRVLNVGEKIERQSFIYSFFDLIIYYSVIGVER
jgi:hypothetical protein